MSLIEMVELKELIAQKRGRLMGLDFGSKTIGLALSDPRHMIGSPLGTIKRVKLQKDLEELQQRIGENDVIALVIGLPLNMDGSEGPRCQSVRQFIENLLSVIDIPVSLWDERLSTVAVTRTMLDADLSRKRRAQIVDKLAASYILQGALDRLANM